MDWCDIDEKTEYDFTLNRQYYEQGMQWQRGKQINNFCEGYFWHNKERQFRYLVLLGDVMPKTIVGTNLTYTQCCELLGRPFVGKKSLSSGDTGTFKISGR